MIPVQILVDPYLRKKHGDSIGCVKQEPVGTPTARKQQGITWKHTARAVIDEHSLVLSRAKGARRRRRSMALTAGCCSWASSQETQNQDNQYKKVDEKTKKSSGMDDFTI